MMIVMVMLLLLSAAAATAAADDDDYDDHNHYHEKENNNDNDIIFSGTPITVTPRLDPPPRVAARRSADRGSWPPIPEVTSLIGKILSESCSAGPIQSKTTPHLPISDNFDFGANFGRKKQKFVRAVFNKTGSYRPILLIFNSKHGIPLGYIVSNFEENPTKITTVRVPQTKSAKWPP